MIYWLITGTVAAVLLLSWVIVVAVASKRVAKSIGTPTPEEARVKAAVAAEVQAIRNQSDLDKAKVNNASDDDLLIDLRNEVRGKK